MSAIRKIGFIGVGNMGAPMAGHLVRKGYDVAVYDIRPEAVSGVYHEIQAGSYIFMDVDYGKNDWTESGIPRFEHSLFVWTTAMSRPTLGRAVVDAGLKASSVDSGMPRVAELEGAEYVKASDEHGVLKLSGGVRLAVGDKLKLIPGHCDPTVNLYDNYVCVRGGKVEAIWPITARGAVW